jgi:hypothetical protein
MTHTYRWNNGKLEHSIDGDLRATVEKANVEAYVLQAGLDPETIPEEGAANGVAWTWRNGKLEHRVDGQLRATVEPKNVDAYLASAGVDPSTVPASPALRPNLRKD